MTEQIILSWIQLPTTTRTSSTPPLATTLPSNESTASTLMSSHQGPSNTYGIDSDGGPSGENDGQQLFEASDNLLILSGLEELSPSHEEALTYAELKPA